MRRKRRRRIEPIPRSMGLNSFYYPDTRLKRQQSGVSFQTYDLNVMGDDLPVGIDVSEDDLTTKAMDDTPIRQDDF